MTGQGGQAPAPRTRVSAIRANVAIIGAGPAGLATAIRLGQLGVERVIVVDRQDFPRGKTCGSAVSPKGIAVLKELGADEAVSAEAYWIKGLRLVTRPPVSNAGINRSRGATRSGRGDMA